MKDTERDKDDRSKSKNVLDNFILIGEPIDLFTQEEYFSFSEAIDFEATYAMVGMLIPTDIAVGEIIEEGISECIKISKFLCIDYYVTNVGKPTHKEILNYLEEIKHGEK